jgi:transposase
VLDNAPAHVAKALVIPANVVLIYLPPYCPELNPIERLWQDLKGRLTGLAATVRGLLSAVREAVEGSSTLIALNNSLPLSPAAVAL